MPNTHPSSIAHDLSLGSLLLEWQSSADSECLALLLAAARPLVERMAASTLRRHLVPDPAAVDDAVSLVFDHLRRLPGASPGETPVARFAPRRAALDGTTSDDAGLTYVIWLARDRAIDVARSRRRIARHIACFSELSADATRRLASRPEDGAAAGSSEAPLAAMRSRLHDAIQLLEPRERTVIEMLLDGKTQVVIAHALDVCEGTVSRLRSKALTSLRLLLDG